MRHPVALIAFASVVLGMTADARDPVRARNGMVNAQEPHATDVGLEVLKKGGNAIDAAVAMGFALAVTHPFAGNIGGGGFMLIRLADGRSTFIDFRERAPGAATRNMYLDASGNATNESVEGWKSSGVPGTVRGMEFALGKYGTRKWADLIAPAIELAKKGFPVSKALSKSLHDEPSLTHDSTSTRILLSKQREGALLKQPELASTLSRIAKRGADEFYEGETAKTFASEMAKHGGLITLNDLRTYKAVERAPLTGTYKGYGVITAPPPSSGGVGILQMLQMLEGSAYEKDGPGSPSAIHYTAEVMRRFFADRSQYLADPDFVSLRLPDLLNPAYIRSRRATIDPNHVTPSSTLLPGLSAAKEHSETTHYNVVDAQGNAVAVTYTLNGGFGNGITVPGLGFLLNNEMDDFTAKPGVPNQFGLIQGELNSIEPQKRPLSAMTPTMLTKDGQFFLSVGAPGGPRIISAVLQVILNVVDFGMNIQDAVDAPRFHHQWQPDRLYMEPAFPAATVEALQARGHVIDHSPGLVLARVEAILKRDGWLEGASDLRAAGKSAGY